jgi:AraC-like DNA-binding protein
MQRWSATVDLDSAIPRVEYRRNEDETLRAYMTRVAASISFAFLLDPDEVVDQPDFTLDTQMIVLPEGLVSRTASSGSFTLSRDKKRIEATSTDHLLVYFIEQGAVEVTPTRSSRLLQPGDILLLDLNRPGALLQHNIRNIRIIMPRSALTGDIDEQDLHGCVIPAGHPLAGLMRECAKRLIDDAPRMTQRHGSVTLRMIFELLSTALADRIDVASADLPLKTRIDLLINHNLDRHELTPGWIADRLGISRATLYRTIQYNGGGVKDLITDRRRLRAWSMLTDVEGDPFADIARRSGFGTRAKLAQSFAKLLGKSLDEIRFSDPDTKAKMNAAVSEMLLGNWENRIGRR